MEPQPQQTENKKSEEKTNNPPEQKPPVTEIHHHHYHSKPMVGRLLMGIMLLGIGFAFFARSAGWVHFEFTFNWDMFWPLLIIIFGLAIISRGGWVISVVSLLIVITVIGFAWSGFSTHSTSTTTPLSVEQAEGATSLDLSVDSGAGKLSIVGMSEKAVTGSLLSRTQSVSVTSRLDETKQIVGVQVKGDWLPFGISTPNTLTLQLSSDLISNLTIHTGASTDSLNLSDIKAERVSIATGASTLDLTLGNLVPLSTVNVDAGASSINVTLPKALGARVHLETGLTSKSMPEFDKKDDATYESKNYSVAEQKTDITLKTGASSITFNWK